MADEPTTAATWIDPLMKWLAPSLDPFFERFAKAMMEPVIQNFEALEKCLRTHAKLLKGLNEVDEVASKSRDQLRKWIDALDARLSALEAKEAPDA